MVRWILSATLEARQIRFCKYLQNWLCCDIYLFRCNTASIFLAFTNKLFLCIPCCQQHLTSLRKKSPRVTILPCHDLWKWDLCVQ